MSKSKTESQLNSGISFYEQGKLEEAKAAWQAIQREDSPETFAKAQFCLGVLFYKKGELEKAKVAWQAIQREDSPEAFARAQFGLGLLFKKQRKLDEAKDIWQSIQREDSPKAFVKSQYYLGLLLEEQKKFDEAVSAYKSVEKEFFLERFYEIEIKLSIFSLEEKDIRERLLFIYNTVKRILSELKINHEDEINVAHYTRPFIGDLLLRKEDREAESKLRLSTIKGVNDPEEGNVLSKLLKYDFEENNLLTFISCFTFNHDSLNQFRLYGKENGEESSGISLVFDLNKFFDQKSEIYKGIRNLDSISSFEDSPSKEQKENVSKLPLYRCIYLESFDDGEIYLHVAHREELTFYREKNSDSKANKKWKGYQTVITKIESKVKNEFDKIIKNIKKLNLETKDVAELLGEILLPLRFLIKHSAFREEQECRVMYITDICDSKIKTQLEQNQIYVDYEPSVKEAIHKIYLSSGASKYRDHFRRLLEDKEGIKVINSKNPFRVKV